MNLPVPSSSTFARATRITLRIDGPGVPAADFARAIKTLNDVLEANILGPDGRPVRWVVSVEKGSNLVHFDPQADAESGPIAVSVGVVYENFEQLERGEDPMVALDRILGNDPHPPERFGVLDLKRARTLAQLTRGASGVTSVEILTNGRRLPLTGRTAAHVSEVLRPHYESKGSLRGRLDVLRNRGQAKAALYNDFYAEPVRCFVHDALWKEVRRDLAEAFVEGRRVNVTGTVHYRKDGTPISITSDDFEILNPVPLTEVLGIWAD